MPDKALFWDMQCHSLRAGDLPCTKVCLISLCFNPMWGPWGGSWLQLAGRSHCLCTFVSLQGNYQVKELDLSHNEFSEKGGQLLGQMLGNLIYYSHKARSAGTGGLDSISTVYMYFLLQQKCPMTWWVTTKDGAPRFRAFCRVHRLALITTGDSSHYDQGIRTQMQGEKPQ